jgi:hypothetical protein
MPSNIKTTRVFPPLIKGGEGGFLISKENALTLRESR